MFSSGFPPALRALNHRNFRLFFGGQLVSLTGTWMQSIAQAWLVYRLTDSAILLGLVGQIPVFLLASLGGTMADRHDRRRILIATQSIAMLLALTLALLTLTGSVQVWHTSSSLRQCSDWSTPLTSPHARLSSST